jgi:hypothetical protein
MILLPLSGRQQAIKDEDIIREVIAEGYIKGVWLEGDEVAMRKGFDVDFVKLTLHGNHVHKHPLNWWIENISKKMKEKKRKDPVTFKIPLVDVTGNAAVAKIQLFKNKKLIATDYVGLYKFGEFWQMVNMITEDH